MHLALRQRVGQPIRAQQQPRTQRKRQRAAVRLDLWADATARVITFRRGERFEVFGAGLRVGNNGLHVDNAHGGGIFCEIDPATGVIMTDGLDEHGNSYLCHPMTGVPFRGEVIPQWEEVRAFCRSAAQTLPCLRVVGWDVAILPGGKLELIEATTTPA